MAFVINSWELVHPFPIVAYSDGETTAHMSDTEGARRRFPHAFGESRIFDTAAVRRTSSTEARVAFRLRVSPRAFRRGVVFGMPNSNLFEPMTKPNGLSRRSICTTARSRDGRRRSSGFSKTTPPKIAASAAKAKRSGCVTARAPAFPKVQRRRTIFTTPRYGVSPKPCGPTRL